MLLGLAATALVGAAHLAGLDTRVEHQALDMRFRTLASAPADEQIVQVCIDDNSIKRLGRWPWSRAMQGAVLSILRECGAKTIAPDIIYHLPQEPRYDAAVLDYYGDYGRLIGQGPPVAVFDDVLLAESIQRCGNVTLAMHMDLLSRQPPTILEADLERRVATRPSLPIRTARREVDAASSPELQAQAADEEAFWKAYLRARALTALERFALPADDFEGYPLAEGPLVPPLVGLARRAHTAGFVTVTPDGDGVVRRIPLLARSGRGVYMQFAFAVAVDELARRHGGECNVSAGASSITLTCGDGFRREIPIDSEGAMLVNWFGDEDDLRKISVLEAAIVWELRRRISDNRRFSRLLALSMAQALNQGDMLELYLHADELYNRRIEVERRLNQAMLFEPADAEAMKQLTAEHGEVVEEEARVEAEIAGKTTSLLGELDFYLQGASEEQTKPLLDMRENIRQLEEANGGIESEIARHLASLTGKVAERICLIGSTATAAADFTPTPMNERMPGVTVHSNILNTVLSGAFIRRAGWWGNLLAILAVGSLVSLLATTRPALQAAPLTALLAAAYVAFNALVVFARWNVWLAVVAPVGAMLASFMVVSVYRQLTEERAKRQIRAIFAHAMSPALVDRLIEDPSVAKLGGERRVLSVYFSDLEGFTPISERLGEQQTVRLLNHYFDHMTEVIQNRSGGYLNKFLGDGIFVFFGAPVFQDDHARRAIRAAVESQQEVKRLNRELAEEHGSEEVTLACRIGIATGEVMVGNCGSTDRLDYTAIGDTVNLASRLEGANKAFGTRIMVAESTWRDGGSDEWPARRLGKILVVGKQEPVSVWSLHGCRADTGDDELRNFEDFARGVEEFQRRNFEKAKGVFEAILERTPDDKAASLYVETCRMHLVSPPADDWNGAIELTEK